jgi:hypothetical protein
MLRARLVLLSLAALGMLAARAAAEPVISGAVLYYGFDNAANPMDGSIGGGTVTGAFDSVTSPWSQGIQSPIGEYGASNYNDNNTNYIDITNSSSLGGAAPTDAMTMAFWVKAVAKVPVGTTTVANQSQNIFRTPNALGGFRVFLRGNDDTIAPNNTRYSFRFSLYNPAGTAIVDGDWPSNVNAVNLGAWTHVAWTYDASGNAGAGQCKFYLNGIDTGTPLEVKNGGGPIGTQWVEDAIRAQIGKHSSGRNLVSGLDEFYLFNRALSGNEIGLLATVPEPGSWVLLSGIFLGLLAYARRRKRN